MKKVIFLNRLSLIAVMSAMFTPMFAYGQQISAGAVVDEIDNLAKESIRLGVLQLTEKKTEQDLATQAQTNRNEDYQIKNDARRLQSRQLDIQRRAQNAIKSGCPAQDAPTNDEDLVERCNPIAQQVKSDQDQLLKDAQALQRRAHDLPIAVAKVSKDTLKLTADMAETTSAMSEIQARIDALKKFLRQSLAVQCPEMSPDSTIEEIKAKCGNPQFDLSYANLPPCLTEECLEASREDQ